MVTSLFNLYGGSGGGVTEEKVLQLIKSNGAPILVEYNDIDTELGLEIYANPEKYVIKNNRFIYSYNQTVSSSGTTYRIYSNIAFNNVFGANKHTYQRYLYVNNYGEAALMEDSTKDLGVALMQLNVTGIYDKIKNEPENYMLYLYLAGYEETEWVIFHYHRFTNPRTLEDNTKLIYQAVLENYLGKMLIINAEITAEGIEFKQYYIPLIDDYYTKDEIDNKIGNIEILLSEI